MDEKKFDEYIKDRYNKQVDWYDRKSIQNKQITYILQISTIIMAAIVPVFAVMENKLVTIILSISVSAGVSILKFGKFEEHWHNYRTTCETLKKEKVYYDMRLDDYEKASEPEKLFIERVEDIISKEHTKWSHTVKRNKSDEVINNSEQGV